MACCEVAQAVSEKFLRQHERNGHFYMPGFHVNCPACALGKDLNKTSHKKQRPAHLIPVRFLSQVDWDFKGPLPASFKNRRWILSAVDAKTGYIQNYPVFSKDECGAKLEQFIREVGQMDRVRTDNDPVFKGDKASWQQAARSQRPHVVVTFSSPYEPQQNGRAERWMRTQSDAIR